MTLCNLIIARTVKRTWCGGELNRRRIEFFDLDFESYDN
jgi:hypothetical protein